MNWIVVLTRNNIALTKRAIKTFRAQDISDIGILVIDNHSTDGTDRWLNTQHDLLTIYNRPEKSVAASWNMALRWLFGPKWINGIKNVGPIAEYALVVNNDVELRADTYRRLVADGGGFVTAVGTRDRAKIEPPYHDPDPKMVRPHPDFSCYLIRREVWERVGEFDENFTPAFCEDGDYDLRMYRAGVRAYCLDLPFLHHGSMTVKNAEPTEARRICLAADKNREYFKKKWGFAMGSEEYYRALDKGGPPSDDEPPSAL